MGFVLRVVDRAGHVRAVVDGARCSQTTRWCHVRTSDYRAAGVDVIAVAERRTSPVTMSPWLTPLTATAPSPLALVLSQGDVSEAETEAVVVLDVRRRAQKTVATGEVRAHGSSRRRPVAGHRLLQAGDCITVAAHGQTRHSGCGHRLQLSRSDVGEAGIREGLVRAGDKCLRVVLVAEQLENEIDQLDHGTPFARRIDGSRLALGR